MRTLHTAASWDEPDAVFTCVINLMEQLARLAEVHAPWARDELVVAAAELQMGPWQHIGAISPDLALPFAVQCSLLDDLLERLHCISPGFGARVAIAKARSWLDPDHSPTSVFQKSSESCVTTGHDPCPGVAFPYVPVSGDARDRINERNGQ